MDLANELFENASYEELLLMLRYYLSNYRNEHDVIIINPIQALQGFNNVYFRSSLQPFPEILIKNDVLGFSVKEKKETSIYASKQLSKPSLFEFLVTELGVCILLTMREVNLSELPNKTKVHIYTPKGSANYLDTNLDKALRQFYFEYQTPADLFIKQFNEGVKEKSNVVRRLGSFFEVAFDNVEERLKQVVPESVLEKNGYVFRKK